jgi:hypothetical protein
LVSLSDYPILPQIIRANLGTKMAKAGGPFEVPYAPKVARTLGDGGKTVARSYSAGRS